jgi:molybdate transport system substrate-binding protein
MRIIALAAVLAAMTVQAAAAAEINVFVPPLMNAGGLPAIGKAFEAKTGIKVNVTSHAMGRSINDIEKGPVAPDVIFTLTDYMGTLALDKALKTNFTPFARVYMGMAVLKGAPIPDISTVDKLAAVLKASKGITYSDPSPARGSVEASVVDAMLRRPEFAGAKGLHATTDNSGKAAPNGPNYLIQGHGDMTMQPMNEMAEPELVVVGPLPEELHSFLDSSVAISARSADPTDAAAFIKFAYTPEARALLTKGTIPFPNN